MRRSPQFERGYRKEYHVFDSRDLPSEEWMRDRILGMADDELQKARRGEPADPVQLHRASMYVDPEFYFDYFAGLLRSRPRIRLTADVTPDYAMLSVDRMLNIKSSFEARRVRTVAAFLMRDPVERVWSQIRMQQGRDPNRFPAPAEEMVARLYDEPIYDMRTRYDKTIATVDSVFAEDEVYYGFYETLFSDEEVRKICELTGIRFRPPNFDRMANVSQAKPIEWPAGRGHPDGGQPLPGRLRRGREAVPGNEPDRALGEQPVRRLIRTAHAGAISFAAPTVRARGSSARRSSSSPLPGRPA